MKPNDSNDGIVSLAGKVGLLLGLYYLYTNRKRESLSEWMRRMLPAGKRTGLRGRPIPEGPVDAGFGNPDR